LLLLFDICDGGDGGYSEKLTIKLSLLH